MRFYIVRHGEAQGQAASDSLRQLTQQGRQEVAELWQQLREQGIVPSMLLSSPYTRAQQTAAIIASCYSGIERLECPCCTPEDNVPTLIAWLQQQPLTDGWVLVSHMPLVAVLAGVLTEGLGARLSFATGAVACLDMDVMAPQGGRLLWQRQV